MNLTRHTTRVTVLRWILPVLAGLTLLGVAAWPALKEMEISRIASTSGTRLKVEEVSLSLPKENKPMELQVSHPEYSGLDEKNRPYVIRADKVIQQGVTPGQPPGTHMTLEQPVATLTLKQATDDHSDENISLNANHGVYDPKAKTLQLDGMVKFRHSTGYELYLSEMSADLTRGYLVSTHPVTGFGPGGELSGESLEILDRGNHIILKGRSKMILNTEKQ